MKHKHNDMPVQNNKEEYAKFVFVISFIFAFSSFHAMWVGLSTMQFLESFMGVFFLVFAGFKLYRIKEFAYGFQSYDVLAKRSLTYAYAYPFIQLIFGILYVFGFGNIYLDATVLVVSLISGYGVIQTLQKGKKVHCVCLGNVIKLPLSTISFVEDFGMALMAVAMIVLR